MVSVNNKTYYLQYSESFSGGLFMTSNNEPFVTLGHALSEVFSSSLLNYQTALLTIGDNTVAIFRPFPEVFKIFDSHSRDRYGMPCSYGYCVLTCVEQLQNLVKYFQLSLNSDGTMVPFELKGVTCVVQNELSNETDSDRQKDCKKRVSKKREECQEKLTVKGKLDWRKIRSPKREKCQMNP